MPETNGKTSIQVIERMMDLLDTLARFPDPVNLKRLAKRAGIDKRVHPHGFRHSHAVHLLRKGVPLPDIQRQLGHLNLATTDEYLRGLGAGEHVEKVRDLEW